MDWTTCILTNPQVMHGAACFRRKRISVSVVVDNLIDGLLPEQILQQHTSPTLEHVAASLACAADLAQERIFPIPA